MHAEETMGMVMKTAQVSNTPVLNGATATSALLGGAVALPALPAGYVSVNINGTVYKLAYFNV